MVLDIIVEEESFDYNRHTFGYVRVVFGCHGENRYYVDCSYSNTMELGHEMEGNGFVVYGMSYPYLHLIEQGNSLLLWGFQLKYTNL